MENGSGDVDGGRRRLREKNAGHPAHLATHFSMGYLLFLIIVISQNGFCP